jgi:hypothetical protein
VKVIELRGYLGEVQIIQTSSEQQMDGRGVFKLWNNLVNFINATNERFVRSFVVLLAVKEVACT